MSADELEIIRGKLLKAEAAYFKLPENKKEKHKLQKSLSLPGRKRPISIAGVQLAKNGDDSMSIFLKQALWYL